MPSVYVLPVDAPCRQDRLEILSDRLGVEIEVNWRKPINTSGQRDGNDHMVTPLEELRPSEDAVLMAKHPIIEILYTDEGENP